MKLWRIEEDSRCEVAFPPIATAESFPGIKCSRCGAWAMVGRIPLELPDSAVESIRRLPGSCEAVQFWEAAQRVLSESGLSAAMPIIEPGYAYGQSKVTRIKTLRGGKIGWHAFRMLTIATSSFNVSRAEDYGLNILHCVAPGNEVIEIVPDKLPLRLFYRTLECSECRSIDRMSFSMPLFADALAAEFSRGRTLVSTIGGTLTDERGRKVIDSLNLKGVLAREITLQEISEMAK